MMEERFNNCFSDLKISVSSIVDAVIPAIRPLVQNQAFRIDDMASLPDSTGVQDASVFAVCTCCIGGNSMQLATLNCIWM